jgi:hypothetical protein
MACSAVAAAVCAEPLTTAPANVRISETRERGRVVLAVRDVPAETRWQLAERRIADELRAVGFDVLVLALREEQGSPRKLEGLAKSNEAFAALLVSRDERTGQVEIWLADRVTGKTTLRTLDAKDVVALDAVNVLAVRVVELLQASLLEVRAWREQRAAQDVPAAAEQLIAAAEQSRLAPRYSLHAGPILLTGPGGFGALAGLRFGSGLALGRARHFALGLDVSGTLPSKTVTTAAGETRVGLAALQVGVRYWFDPRSHLAWGLNGAAGPALSFAEGRPNDSFEGRFDATVTAFGSAGLLAALRLAPTFRALFALQLSYSVPQLELRTPEASPMSAGHPWVDAGLLLEWGAR